MYEYTKIYPKFHLFLSNQYRFAEKDQRRGFYLTNQLELVFFTCHFVAIETDVYMRKIIDVTPSMNVDVLWPGKFVCREDRF